MRLEANGTKLPAMGLGCMSMSLPGHDDEESVRTLQAAIDAGLTLLDTADRYGRGHNENLVGRALRGRRDDVVLATKVGFVGRSTGERPVDGSPEHIRRATAASLRRLGVDHIDLLYLHRVDPHVPVEETMGAMADLVTAGAVRHLGLSEVSPKTLRQAAAVHSVAAVQSEYSLWSREPEDDVLPVCRELGAVFVAYSPLGKGFLTGTVRSAADIPPGSRLASTPRVHPGNLERNLPIVDGLTGVAMRLGCTPAQLALAWLVEKAVVPIPGSARLAHLRENLGALDVRLAAEDVAELERAAPPGAAVGERKSASGLGLIAR